MNWKVESGENICNLFVKENYFRNLASDVVGIYFEKEPTVDKVKVFGQISCPGCKKWYPFEIVTWVIAEGSTFVRCSDPGCRDETKVTAYRGQEQDIRGDNPIFIFAEPYITKRGQLLSNIALMVSDVIE